MNQAAGHMERGKPTDPGDQQHTNNIVQMHIKVLLPWRESSHVRWR